MDYISFVNSRDIREHLRRIDYQLNGEQKLFLIDNCYHITMDERLEALESLLEGPDETVIIRNPCFFSPDGKEFSPDQRNEHRSLHEIASGLIDHYRELIRQLGISQDGSCFEASCLRNGSHGKYEMNITPRFADCRSAMSYVGARYRDAREDTLKAVKLIKRYFFQQGDDRGSEDKSITAYFDVNFELMRISGCLNGADDEDYEYTMEGLLIYLPTPFEKGDIVDHSPESVYRHWNFIGRNPFIIDDEMQPNEEISRGADSSDISVWCLYLETKEDLNPCAEVEIHNYDLEYCRSPLREILSC
ncbi:MAG: hypothetical protein IJ523_09415 [Succinivibrionaceae bacterium]|nr:hypothetical protein [Succinivibrionaceae bacterium]